MDCRLPLAVVVLLILSGCGADGPARFNLAGSVTFNGQPVPTGHIRFEPDTAAGNTGPGTHADVKNGRYQTLKGQGVVGGPHVITIAGADGVPFDMGGGIMNPQGKPLFPDYVTKVDLPKESGTRDFTVPAP